MKPNKKLLIRFTMRIRMTILSRWQRLWIGIYWSMTTGKFLIPTAIEQWNISSSSFVPNKDFKILRTSQNRWEEAEELERRGFWHKAVNIREEVLTDLYDYQGIIDKTYFPPLLGTTWSSNFGHISLIGHHKLAQQLGITPAGKRYLLDDKKSANPELLLQVSNGISIVSQKSGTRWSDMPSFWHLSERMRTVKTINGFMDMNMLVDEIFSEKNLVSLKDNYLNLSEEYSVKSEKELEEFGLPKSAKFVALHIREGGPLGDPRAQPLESFMPAIKEITRNGFWVVRFGDQSMESLPNMNMVIDLVPKKNSARELNAYVIARCLFYLGTHSGPAWVPRIFGRPALITNVIDVATKVGRAPQGSIHIPKKYINQQGETISLEQLFRMRFAFASPQLPELKSKGISIQANSSEEIFDATKEIIESVVSNKIEPSFYSESIDSIRHLYGAPAWGNFSNRFLSKNPDWISRME
jgi:putative glycosyltransferase (TIGR04372 family)